VEEGEAERRRERRRGGGEREREEGSTNHDTVVPQTTKLPAAMIN
jgi:hypothetical protein